MTLDLGMLRLGDNAGCACKASWATVETLRKSAALNGVESLQLGLLDAGAFSSGKSREVASVDFIGPVSRAAEDYGAIAAAHAMSDLFAVGVEPRAALAIAVWPRDPTFDPALHEAMGALFEACRKVGCVVIGGHTANADQPLLGLCVIGEQNQIPKKEPVRSGDLLYLTKPLGSGIAVSAIKEGVCSDRTEKHALAVMRELNVVGIQLNLNPLVKIATDITGYGLCGQLLRLSESTGQNIVLNARRIPTIDGVLQLAERAQGTQSAERNWGELKSSLDCDDWLISLVVCDPQTNGPILFVADAAFATELDCDQQQFVLIGELAGPSLAASQKPITIR